MILVSSCMNRPTCNFCVCVSMYACVCGCVCVAVCMCVYTILVFISLKDRALITYTRGAREVTAIPMYIAHPMLS